MSDMHSLIKYAQPKASHNYLLPLGSPDNSITLEDNTAETRLYNDGSVVINFRFADLL